MSRNTIRSAAPRPPCVTTATADAPEERFARHVRAGLQGLLWHHELGRLTLECCPRGTPNRTRRLQALADDNPPCSLSLLHRAMKFARQYRWAEVLRLERDGLGWDQLTILLPMPRAERDEAMAEVIRLGLTSRQLRLWREGTYGVGRSRGGRMPTPIPGYPPDVQARALTNDCRRLCVRHENTAEVFEGALRAIEAGAVPTPEEFARVRVAADATRSLLEQFGPVYALLERIAAACEESPTVSEFGS